MVCCIRHHVRRKSEVLTVHTQQQKAQARETCGSRAADEKWFDVTSAVMPLFEEAEDPLEYPLGSWRVPSL